LEFIFSFKAVILLLCFFLSAFFSGSEVALFSLNPKKIKLQFKGKTTQRYLTQLLEFPKRLLVTILIGNTLVNTTASIIAVSIALEVVEKYKYPDNIILPIQVILLTVLLVLVGEISPKIYASKRPVTFAKVVAVPLFFIHAVLYPVAEVMTELLRISTSKLRKRKKRKAISHEDFSHLAKLGHEDGTLAENEQELIEGLINYKNVLVKEIMSPRVDIKAVSSDATLDEIITVIKNCGHSRIPVYKTDIDDILGILYAKDLLPYFSKGSAKQNFSLMKCMHKVIYIPETKIISELLHEFQEKNIHLAIAVDEFGGTAGLITLEDILEEIVGEIRYESDKEEDKIKKIDNDVYTVAGSATLHEVNEYFDLKLPDSESDFETIGGYVIHQAGTIPAENFSIPLGRYVFTVAEIRKKRVLKIRVQEQK